MDVILKDGKLVSIDSEEFKTLINQLSVIYSTSVQVVRVVGKLIIFRVKNGEKLVYNTEIGVMGIYNAVMAFSGGFAPVLSKETRLFGYINTEGELVIPCEYGKAYAFSCNRAVVQNKEKTVTGVINEHGETVVPFIYGNITLFKNNIAEATPLFGMGKKVVFDINYNIIEG